MTSFCDLLVTPVLTLGLPLVCWLLEPQQRLRAGTRQCGIVVGGSLTWGVGYLLCWASKWVLAGLVTGQNVIADALHQVGVRTAADSWHGMELTWRNILHFVYTTLAGKHLFWPLVLAVVLLLALFAASIRDRQQLALRADDPGVVHRAAHPQHPARLVHLARTGTDRLCRAGVFVLLL